MRRAGNSGRSQHRVEGQTLSGHDGELSQWDGGDGARSGADASTLNVGEGGITGYYGLCTYMPCFV
jgi:hypothetical protein